MVFQESLILRISSFIPSWLKINLQLPPEVPACAGGTSLRLTPWQKNHVTVHYHYRFFGNL